MKPVSSICASIYGAGHHAVIGVSPFNSYFSEDRLAALFTWADSRFEGFHIFIPDEATRYTLEALGYDSAKARRKARRQANYLMNKIERALDVAVPDYTRDRILTNAVLGKNDAYMGMLKTVERRFERDEAFRESCTKCTRWVLENQAQEDTVIDAAATNLAVRYFLEELPLFMDSASIVGAASSVFCYQKCPEALKGFYTDRSGALVAGTQGFIEVDALDLVVVYS